MINSGEISMARISLGSIIAMLYDPIKDEERKMTLMTETKIDLNLDQIRKAVELGNKEHGQYMQHACADRTIHRWNDGLAAQEHVCPPHHWLIDSQCVGQCKYCGEVKDFAELLAKERAGPAGAHHNRTTKQKIGENIEKEAKVTSVR